MASVAPLISSLARQYGLDPRAVLAVARGEGGLVNRPGTQDIGDLAGGGSYGPFQLYAKGALPRRLVGNQAAADAWAWSPEGIRYALSKMAPFAKGRTGADAVRQIITRFERPANPQKSIALALGRLGSSGTAPALPPATPSSNGAGTARLSALREALGQGPLALVRALQAAGPETPLGAPVSPSQPLPGPGRFSVEELFHDPLGGFKHGRPTGAIGGHDKHVHVAEDDPAQMLQIILLAKRLGLRVSENPWVDPVDPVHTKNSYHYRGTPFRGRRMGRATDVSGNPAAMRKFYAALAPKNARR